MLTLVQEVAGKGGGEVRIKFICCDCIMLYSMYCLKNVLNVIRINKSNKYFCSYSFIDCDGGPNSVVFNHEQLMQKNPTITCTCM